MNYIYLTGFGFGTFKFLFVHWTVYAAAQINGDVLSFFDLFIPTTAGALFASSIFYFASDKLMERAAAKRMAKKAKSLETGIPLKEKKKFTWINKAMVKMKRTFGIYGITLLAPLFLSVPIGSIVCAKFYGNLKKTFPLMVLNMTGYSALMSGIIYFLNA